MNDPAIATAAQVFIGAGVLATLIDKYTVHLLTEYNRSTAEFLNREIAAQPARVEPDKRGALTLFVQILQRWTPVLFPWFELIFAALAVAAFREFGESWACLRAVVFVAFALPLAMIALIARWTAYTPFILTMPGILVALATSLLPGALPGIEIDWMLQRNPWPDLADAIARLTDAILGACIGGIPLFLIARSFRGSTGEEGIATGSLVASVMIGAFCGTYAATVYLLVLVTVGAPIGTLWGLITKPPGGQVPFTPIQCACGVVALIWGHTVMTWYRAIF